MSVSKFTEAWLKSKIRKLERDSVEQVSADIEKSAKSNFRRAEVEIPSANKHIEVWRSKQGENEYTVTAGGFQVLFVEFGAGIAHSTETSTVGFNGSNVQHDIAEKPAGIYNIGGFGKHRGLDDSWIFTDVNFIVDNGKNHTHWLKQNSKGEWVYRTGGIRPIRALWRARCNAIRKLLKGGRIRRIG